MGDRLAVAEHSRVDNSWTVFRGDQIGTMLGKWMWDTRDKSDSRPVAMVASTVSSKMLRAVGEKEGFRFEETLTGFKWIGSRSVELGENEGYNVLFGYEEAIGFCCGDVINDKDGVSAAGVFAELARAVYGKGGTMKGFMQGLYDEFGEFVTNNGYFFCHDKEVVKSIFNKIANGGKYMDDVGGYKITGIRDLGLGYDSSTDDKKPRLPVDAASPMLTLNFENGCCAQFRASGTEPKFKYYIELRGQRGETRLVVEENLRRMSAVLLEVLLEPEKNGLRR